MYQKCPVCGGRGIVPHGFYETYSPYYSSSGASPETCRTCRGTGVLFVQEYSTFTGCFTCAHRDPMIYTSNPPKYKCNLDNSFYETNHSCSKYEEAQIPYLKIDDSGDENS